MLVFGRLRKEDRELETSLGHVVRLCSIKTKLVGGVAQVV
jgi:hypothetical protein